MLPSKTSLVLRIRGKYTGNNSSLLKSTQFRTDNALRDFFCFEVWI
jgi:hypothetical protein